MEADIPRMHYGCINPQMLKIVPRESEYRSGLYVCLFVKFINYAYLLRTRIHKQTKKHTHIYTCTCEGEGALVHLFIYRIMHINSHLLFSPSIQPSTGLTMHIFIYPLSQLQIQHNDMYSDKGTPINQRHSSRHASLHKHNQAFRLCYQTWN